MSMEINGKNVLLTGGSSGLGPLIATALAQKGANLALVARTREKLEEVASRLATDNSKCLAFPADLSRDDGIEQLVEDVEGELGPVDILINNAGLESPGRFVSKSTEEIQQVLATNLQAPLLLSRAVLPGMLERGGGHIVTVASLAGKVGLPHAAVYSGTKAALLAWSESLRIELQDTPVNCSLVTPGYVADTGMFAAHQTNPPAYLKATTPDQVVNGVLTALRDNRPEVIVSGGPFKPLHLLYVLAPSLLTTVLRRLGLFDWMEKTYNPEA